MKRPTVVLHLVTALLAVAFELASTSNAETVGRIHVVPESSTIVGGRLVVSIDVLTDAGWAKLASPPKIDVPGALTFVPPAQSLRVSDTINGETYSGSRVEVWLFPLESGELTIPNMEVVAFEQSFAPQGESKRQMITLDGVRISVEPTVETDRPSGPYPVTSQLSLSQSWSDIPGKVLVGDGITRSVVQTAKEIPTLLLNPVDLSGPASCEKADREPTSNNDFNRGTLTSARTDSATYIFRTPGTISFPAVNVKWIEASSGELRTATVDGLEVVVQAVAEAEQGNAAARTREGGHSPVVVALGLVLLITLALYAGLRLFGRWMDWKPVPGHIERKKFRAVQRAAQSGNATSLLSAAYDWSSSVVEQERGLHSWLVQEAGTSKHLETLENCVFEQKPFGATQDFMTTFRKARQSYLKRTRQRAHASVLPPLRKSGAE